LKGKSKSRTEFKTGKNITIIKLFAWLFLLVKDYIKILNTVEHAYVIVNAINFLCNTIGN
jgi:hypothetical protein